MDKNNFIDFKITKELLQALDNPDDYKLNISYKLKNNKGENLKIHGNIFSPFIYDKKLDKNFFIDSHIETQK
jgi:hypothetical protein